MMTCACGGRLVVAEGITGYWPYIPHRCEACGLVTYVDGRNGSEAQEDKVGEYDSWQDTWSHIEKVRGNLFQVTAELVRRSALHDQSKLHSPEKEVYDRVTPLKRQTVYGSPEYQRIMAEMGDIPAYHYKHNRHHPEHFTNGINGMSLLDIIEMLSDWKAASEDYADGSLATSIEKNVVRFGIGEQLAGILRNTARELGWLSE